MRSKQITLKLNGYLPYCSLLSSIFKLTARETQVLGSLMDFNDQVVDSGSRKYARIQLAIDQFSLNNHIKALKDKGALLASGDTYTFHPILRIDDDQQSLIIQFDGKKTI